jgi:hypothetical protein
LGGLEKEPYAMAAYRKNFPQVRVLVVNDFDKRACTTTIRCVMAILGEHRLPHG